MTTKPAETFPAAEYLAAEMTAREWTAETVAKYSFLKVATIKGILDGTVLITPSMSARLAEVFETSELLWLRLDHAHRVAQQAGS